MSSFLTAGNWDRLGHIRAGEFEVRQRIAAEQEAERQAALAQAAEAGALMAVASEVAFDDSLEATA